MELSKLKRKEGMKISGKEKLIVLGFVWRFEVIPHTLLQNSDLDPFEILNKLR